MLLGVGDRGFGRGGGWARCGPLFRGYLSHAEVQNLGLAARSNENVGGLDVAMDDIGAVCRIQRVSNLDTQFEHLVHFEPLPGDAVPERLTLEQLHGNERLALMLLDLIDRRDIRVIEGGSSACLTLEAFERLR